ncbi:unnamed protein product, partial [Mesorhabditis spiculigera]
MRPLFLAALLVLGILAVDEAKEDDGPIVNTKYGPVQGLKVEAKDGSSANVFLGIRYANAPDNFHRFEKPHIVDKWDFLHHATRFRAACIPVHSEDCLFLNILTPSDLQSTHPVMVFIHGGGFAIGNTEEYGYKKLVDHFVSKGIVVVTIQYRLGPLGFFSLGDATAPGNMGLWDMATALEFLHDVLPAFGGNVNQITVSGQSAGSSAASALTFSPHADVYFHQTIELSGSVFAEYSLSESVVENSFALAKEVGCQKNNEKDPRKILDCMRERTAQEILDGVDRIGPSRTHPNFLKFHPRIDGEFFPYPLDQMLKTAQPKPVLSGFTDQESAIFASGFEGYPAFNGVRLTKEDQKNFTRDAFFKFISENVATEHEHGRKMGPFLDLLEEYYIKRDAPAKPDNKFYVQRYTELLSDLMFVVPTLHDLELRRLQNWPSWLYQITYTSSLEKKLDRDNKGAWHATELKYLFDIFGIKDEDLAPEDAKFQKAFVDSLANFVINGNPSTDSFKWDQVSKDKPWTYANFAETPNMEKTFDPKLVEFWLKRIPKAVGSDHLSKSRLPGAHAHRVHTEL